MKTKTLGGYHHFIIHTLSIAVALFIVFAVFIVLTPSVKGAEHRRCCHN